jgi:hypothetical protein
VGDVTGAAIGLGPCWAHGGLFEFDPLTVCTIYVEGRQVLLCDDCVEKANEQRRQMGLPPHQLARDRKHLGEWPP